MSKGAEINHIWNLTAAKFGTQTTLTYQIELTADQFSEPVTETYTLKLPALHTVHTAGAVMPDTAPTCTSSGVGHTVCTICGETLGENIYIPALGHDYKVSESKAAACTESGYMKYTCVRCADSYTIDIYADHKYQLSETHAATCTEDGYKLYKCSSCGATYREEIPAGQHEYTSELIKQATTEEEGTIRYTCAKCGISYEIAVPKLKAGVNVLIIQDRNSWDTATNLTVLNKLVDDGYIAGWNTISSSSISSFDLTPYGIVMIADDQYSSTYGNLKAAGDKIDAYVQGGGVLLYVPATTAGQTAISIMLSRAVPQRATIILQETISSISSIPL